MVAPPPDLPVNAPIGETRDPNRVAWLALGTLGVYGLVWFYRFGREVDAAGNFNLNPKRWFKQIGILAAFIVTLPVALAHFFVYAYYVSKATDALAKRAKETQVDVEARFIVLLIPFVGVLYLKWLQAGANRVWKRLEARRSARDKLAKQAAAEKAKKAPVEQLVQCPMCNHVITVRYLPGETPMVKCSSCGFSAPYESPGTAPPPKEMAKGD